MDLYVYYRVALADAVALKEKVPAMQAALAHANAVRTAFKQRPEASAGMLTFMEVYSGAPPQQFAQLAHNVEQAAHAAGLGDLIQGERHNEIFQDVLPCA